MLKMLIERQHDLVIFAAIALVMFIIYLVVTKAIRTSRMSPEKIRRAISHIRGMLLFLLFLSFLFLWSSQIYSTILSFAALAAAVAIATKEMLLCVAGSFYRAFARPFSVGDRIEVDGLRGDVIDVGLMSTQVLEIGPGNATQQYTGRTISIPNSNFVTHNVINESSSPSSKDYVLHVFSVFKKVDSNWSMHKAALLESAQFFCGEYFDEATTYMRRMAQKRNVEMPFVEPQININIEKEGEIQFLVRVTVPVYLKGQIEQKIKNRYLEKIWG